MKRIFTIWKDHDGVYVHQTDDKEEAEKHLAEVVAKVDSKEYGTELIAVIEGRRMETTITSRVATVSLS